MSILYVPILYKYIPVLLMYLHSLSLSIYIYGNVYILDIYVLYVSTLMLSSMNLPDAGQGVESVFGFGLGGL